MKAGFGLATLLLLAACDRAPPTPAGNNDAAIAAAEHQAVGDTDAALKEAASLPEPGTKAMDDRSSR